MVTSLLNGLEPAFKIGERTPQYRRSVRRAIEPSTRLGLGMLMGALGAGIVFGDRALIFTEHIDPKSLFGVKMRVRTRAVIDADQRKHGIERNRRKRVGRHSMDFAIEVDGNDRDPSGKGSHRLAEIG